MFCPKCGKDNPPDAKFCNECGFPLQKIGEILSEKLPGTGGTEESGAGNQKTVEQPAVPVKKEDPRKPFVRLTSPLPEVPSPQEPPQVVQPEPVPSALQPVSTPAPVTSPQIYREEATSTTPHPDNPPEMIRNPSLAAALSIIPGLGQVYNGRLIRGVILFIGSLLGLIVFIVPGVCIWIFSCYDAYITAKKINTGEAEFPKKKTVTFSLH